MWRRWQRGERGFGTPPPLPRRTPELRHPHGAADECRVTWVGHSSFLLQVGTLNVLTDPVWSANCAPLPWLGPTRGTPPGIPLDALPPIDLVLQSHDHYDHLDDATVRALAHAHPDAAWCAPLGVAAALRARGVRRTVELDWEHAADVGAARVTCTPAQHFSGRRGWDRDRTLWCGWHLVVGDWRLWFVGDTGRHPDFARLGAALGPFDLVLMPIGAYEPRDVMRPVHLDADEAVAAFVAATAPHPLARPAMVAMHWGTFTLTDEPADEPPRRARDAWRGTGRAADDLWILDVGETRALTR